MPQLLYLQVLNHTVLISTSVVKISSDFLKKFRRSYTQVMAKVEQLVKKIILLSRQMSMFILSCEQIIQNLYYL